jgi:hypothetical protein
MRGGGTGDRPRGALDVDVAAPTVAIDEGRVRPAAEVSMSGLVLSREFVRRLEAGFDALVKQARALDADAYARFHAAHRADRAGDTSSRRRDLAEAEAIVRGLALTGQLRVAHERMRRAMPSPPGYLGDTLWYAQEQAERALHGLVLAELASPDVDPNLVARLRNPWSTCATGAPIASGRR